MTGSSGNPPSRPPARRSADPVWPSRNLLRTTLLASGIHSFPSTTPRSRRQAGTPHQLGCRCVRPTDTRHTGVHTLTLLQTLRHAPRRGPIFDRIGRVRQKRPVEGFGTNLRAPSLFLRFIQNRRLLPLRPFDFPPSPRPISFPVPPLQRVMEPDYQIDTSWCVSCSEQILPKRSLVPIPQQLPPRPPTRKC